MSVPLKQPTSPARLVSLVAPIVVTRPRAAVAAPPRRRWRGLAALVVLVAWAAAMVATLAWGGPVVVPMAAGAVILASWGAAADASPAPRSGRP